MACAYVEVGPTSALDAAIMMTRLQSQQDTSKIIVTCINFPSTIFLAKYDVCDGWKNSVFNAGSIRIQIEAGVHFFGQEKLGRRDYLDYLKLLAKSGDNFIMAHSCLLK